MAWAFLSSWKKSNRSVTTELSSSQRFVRVVERNLYGRFSRSSNSEYMVVWRDADPATRRGGYRDHGEGDYLLLRSNLVVAEGRLERPNDGHVADTGTFILTDWRFGEEARSTLYAFDPQGRIVFHREFGANALKSGLSLDGRFAVLMTATSDHADANQTILIDVEKAELPWSRPSAIQLPNSFEFDFHNAHLIFVLDGKGRYAFSLEDGRFLDHSRWQRERVEWASPYELSRMGRDLLKEADGSLSPSLGVEIAYILRKAISSGIGQSPLEHARALSALGRLSERLGDMHEALSFYLEAEAVNSQAMTIRRITKLRAKLDMSGQMTPE